MPIGCAATACSSMTRRLECCYPAPGMGGAVLDHSRGRVVTRICASRTRSCAQAKPEAGWKTSAGSMERHTTDECRAISERRLFELDGLDAREVLARYDV